MLRLRDSQMKVVHCKKCAFDVYIGRPSKWGNPFRIGIDGSREEVIEKYRRWIMSQGELLSSLGELEGKVLGCWCPPNPCHGGVLVELIKKRSVGLETRIIVAGSRTFSNYSMLEKKCNQVIKEMSKEFVNEVGTLEEYLNNIVIVSGRARGADVLGEKYATQYNFEVSTFPAKWDTLGKKAGMIRNEEMAEYASQGQLGVLVAFWDGMSKGTSQMIRCATQRGLKVYVCEY